jgi:Intracellular proteinase inhibitor
MEEDRSLSVALAADPTPLRAGGKVSWRLTVTNGAAEEALLTFPTAQLAEVILEREGNVGYRWSDDRPFAQVVTERRLEPGATWTLVLDDTLDVEPGVYEALGIVTCIPRPPPVRVEVAVDARS